MPKYSTISLNKLNSCHQDLQTIFNYVVKYFDNSIISGQRTEQEQKGLYKIGREFDGDNWIITGDVVTYKDGKYRKSAHNEYPSMAVDVVPYPIEWDNTDRMRYFVGYVKGIAQMLYDYGVISHLLKTGLDWNDNTVLKDQRFNDFPHFEIYKP